MRYFIPVCLCIAVLTSGCISIVNHKLNPTLESVTKHFDGHTTPITPSGNSFSDEIVTIKTQLVDEGIAIEITNNTLGIIEVDWDRSGYINESGETMRIIHKGINLSNKSTPQAPSVIAGKSKITDYITPAENTNWVKDAWVTKKLFDIPKWDIDSPGSIKRAEEYKANYEKKTVSGIIAIQTNAGRLFYRLNYKLNADYTTANITQDLNVLGLSRDN